MKQMYKKIFSITALTSVIILHASSNNNGCETTPCFLPRSQGRDKTRQVVGSVGHTHLYEMESWYGTLSGMFEYTRSIRPDRIATCLFGCSVIDDCDCKGKTIKIQGCNVTDRDAGAWLADYFYLPQDFSGTISFEPRIENFLFDLDFYIGLDEYVKGMYLRLYGPIVHSRWDLNFCEKVCEEGSADHPEGYFTPDKLDRKKLLNNFAEYACGQSPVTTPETTEVRGGSPLKRVVTKPAVVFQPLKFSKITSDRRTETDFADLRAELGWNIWQNEDYHVGVNIQAAAPTGNKKRACFLFDTLIGNGHHWELGAGLTAHWTFWRNDDETRQVGFYFDANITHLFGARQQRTFDLCCKPNSRYMLAEKVGIPVKNLRASSASGRQDNLNVTPSAQFKNEFAPVANLTTMNVRVNVPAQGDVVAMFNFSWNQWSFDIGYNFWGRACEKIECLACDQNCCPSLCDPLEENTWALKGDAHVYGFANTGVGDFIEANDPIALSATQSKATICSGTSGDTDKKENKNIDNPLFALEYGSNTERLLCVRSGSDQIKTSANPVFLTCEDVNFQPTRGTSHKIFAHFSYDWERDNWAPYLGIGGFGEFGQTSDCCCVKTSCKPCDTSCDTSCNTTCNTGCETSCDPCRSCLSCALSQWGVWVKGGFSFNY